MLKVILSIGVLAVLIVGTAADGVTLWSSDFELPEYQANTTLTTQEGWWHYQGWSSGMVVPFGRGQRARLGGSNGYAEVVLSPWVNNELISDTRFKITMSVSSGAGSNPFKIRIMDNIQLPVVSISFDAASGHVMVRGGDNSDWFDTGAAYTVGVSHKLEIVKENVNWTFSVWMDNNLLVRNYPAGNLISVTGPTIHNTEPGIGYLYIYGGGNGGVPLSTAYTYLDNMSIETIADYDRIWSSDFESPPYILDAVVTGQEGWWHYNTGWYHGMVVTTTQSQRARLGQSNGYSELILSEWVTDDTDEDLQYRVLATASPGNGSEPMSLRVLDDNQNVVASVNFDQASGKILARGGDAGEWLDCGVTYSVGEDYNFEIFQDNNNAEFNLSINGSMVLRGIENEVTPDGIGYLYVSGGGNGGVADPDQYSYVDMMSIDITDDIESLWRADFESPNYSVGDPLTGQQGWWHYQGWTLGLVVSDSYGQRAQLGATNGYGEVLLSPWVTCDDGDSRFQILATIVPGAGDLPCILRVLDNGQLVAVNVKFDPVSGNILAKGKDAADWVDSGVSYVAGETYRLDICLDNAKSEFSLCVNDEWVLADVDTGVSCEGFGYLYFYAGGNSGVPITGQCTYLDDLCVRTLSKVSQYGLPVGAWDRLDSIRGADEITDEGGNITVGYFYNQTDDQIRAWLDLAYLNGLQVIVETPREDGTHHISSDVTLITNYINTFKNHPAVYGWYIADESSAEQHDNVKVGYDLVKTLDDKPVFMCFTLDTGMDPSIFDVYADCYDIMLMDCYITVQGYDEFHYMTTSTFQGRMNHASDHAASAGKEWWAVLQGYGRTDNPAWLARLPTLNELKFMAYYSIYKDAKGYLSWCHYICKVSAAEATDAYPYDGNQWILDVYEPVVATLNVLGEAIDDGKKSGLSDNQSEVLSSFYQDPQTLDYFVVAVNNSNGDKTVSFTVNMSLGDFISAEPVFADDGTAIAINSSGVFSDTLTRYGVGVYKLTIPEPVVLTGGDANGDGVVDVGDLGILAANYGMISGGSWAVGDFNSDGAVDVGDLGILAANYGYGSSSAGDFDADYAEVFGNDADSNDDLFEDSVCSAVGLPLVFGFFLAGLLLVKFKR